MADIRNIRMRPGVRIYLHPGDLVEIMTQPDVIGCFTSEETQKIIEALQDDLNFRANENVKQTEGEKEDE